MLTAVFIFQNERKKQQKLRDELEKYSKSRITNNQSGKSDVSGGVASGKSYVSDARGNETEGFRNDWICGGSIFGTLSNILQELRHRSAFVVPKMKILMTAFQIISSLPFNLDVVYPAFSLKLLRSTSFVSFSASSLGSPQCQAGELCPNSYR